MPAVGSDDNDAGGGCGEEAGKAVARPPACTVVCTASPSALSPPRRSRTRCAALLLGAPVEVEAARGADWDREEKPSGATDPAAPWLKATPPLERCAVGWAGPSGSPQAKPDGPDASGREGIRASPPPRLAAAWTFRFRPRRAEAPAARGASSSSSSSSLAEDADAGDACWGGGALPRRSRLSLPPVADAVRPSAGLGALSRTRRGRGGRRVTAAAAALLRFLGAGSERGAPSSSPSSSSSSSSGVPCAGFAPRLAAAPSPFFAFLALGRVAGAALPLAAARPLLFLAAAAPATWKVWTGRIREECKYGRPLLLLSAAAAPVTGRVKIRAYGGREIFCYQTAAA